MIRFLMITVGALALQAQAKPVGPDFSFLSADAQAVHTQVRTLHEQIHAKIAAVCAPTDRASMESCMTENESSLSVWKDLGRSLHETCLIGRGPGGHGGGERMPPPRDKEHERGPRTLTDAQKQELESKLKSEACSQAITSTQAKLQ